MSRVSAPAEFVSPVPSRLLKDEPFTIRFVVEAVVNDPYVVEARANLFTPENVFASVSNVDDANVHVEVEKE